MRSVLYLFPQLALSPGGIQAVNEDTLRALVVGWPNARHQVLLYVNRTVPQTLETFGDGVRSVPCGMRSMRLARLRFISVFARLVLAQRPDLIVVGHVGLAPLAWLAKCIFEVPYVVWAHGIEVWGLRRRLRVASLACADRVVSVSRYTARELAALDPRLAERTIIVPPAVRNHFRPAPGKTLRRLLGLGNARVVLSVGRLSADARDKGFETMLRALPHILARAPDVRYVLVGDGDDRPRLRSLADRLGVSDATVFAGAPLDRNLPDYYNACDLFVMPALREGFGIVFGEALACGKPVVAGDACGAPDALLDGGLGRMVSPGDAALLAEVVLDFLVGGWPTALTDSARLSKVCLEQFGYDAFERRVQEMVRVVGAGPRDGELAGRS